MKKSKTFFSSISAKLMMLIIAVTFVLAATLVTVSLVMTSKILTEEAVKEGGSDIEMILAGDGTVVTHSDKNEVPSLLFPDGQRARSRMWKRFPKIPSFAIRSLMMQLTSSAL